MEGRKTKENEKFLQEDLNFKEMFLTTKHNSYFFTTNKHQSSNKLENEWRKIKYKVMVVSNIMVIVA